MYRRPYHEPDTEGHLSWYVRARHLPRYTASLPEHASDWLIGDTFLRNVYSLFDYGNITNTHADGPPYIQLLSVCCLPTYLLWAMLMTRYRSQMPTLHGQRPTRFCSSAWSPMRATSPRRTASPRQRRSSRTPAPLPPFCSPPRTTSRRSRPDLLRRPPLSCLRPPSLQPRRTH